MHCVSKIVIIILIVNFVDSKTTCDIFDRVLELISKENAICDENGNPTNRDIEIPSKPIKKSELLASCVYKRSLNLVLSPLDKSRFKKIESKLTFIAAGCSIDSNFCDSKIRDSIGLCSGYLTLNVDDNLGNWFKKNCKKANAVANSTIAKAIKKSVANCQADGAN